MILILRCTIPLCFTIRQTSSGSVMSASIKGLLSPWGEFLGSVTLLILVPLLPLVIDLIAKGTVQESTLFLTAALFTVSQAFGVRSFSVFLVGCLCVGLLLTSYGLVLGVETEANEQASSELGKSTPSSSSIVGNRFTDVMYVLSFGIISYFAIVQGVFRYRQHVVDEECFFEFDTPAGRVSEG